MKLIIISGRSGSGKSTALQALEDVGFYCIDNLPAPLLPDLVNQILRDPDHPNKLAVSIDARNQHSNLKQFPDIYKRLRETRRLDCEVIYLDSSETTLLQRYSATRRKHPLSDDSQGLQQAISYEKQLLEPVSDLAAIRIDTTRLSLYELRDSIKLRVARRQEQELSLQFESFGYKHGIPLDVDFTFDVRCLPNPYWVPELRGYTGQEQPVIEFLEQQPEVQQMLADITGFLEKWLPLFEKNNRSYITVGIGCTGGQHRSVFLSERLAGHFRATMDNVQIRHRELN
ncbi:RNase adapter RapZ [Amphritea pacifica]|uniref:RNase adapter RapZ n=1 Tax=Amphritea pacifica TaxID=2811233 RepID=A0ABS2WAN4_9GAMM|nr:RNase adapter RapZ [Amphritea pacifica]MBN0988787.1 RNase adapter RapZ [Amphritea pacifica]MBN1007758.1 RNase adapter RapZ [Amphritea pacifica]